MKHTAKPGSVPTDFLIVGIGASAGGLEALELLVSNIVPDSRMAFIIVQHLSATHKSVMDALLQKKTSFRVIQAKNNTKVKPGYIYLNQPDKDLMIKDGSLILRKSSAPDGHRLPIDMFFKSLAEDQQQRSVCIILSGSGSDGTAGLRFIKDKGGMVLVQDETQAKFNSMPHSAIATGLVDHVLSAEGMPEFLNSIVTHHFLVGADDSDKGTKIKPEFIAQIMKLILSGTGHDFSGYKLNTIGRRISRRMAVRQLGDTEDYVRFLKQSDDELQTLSNELLIGVTSFFRDPEAFAVLQEKVLAPLIMSKGNAESLRIWVAGCATGEEAYSIAILITELLAKAKKRLHVNIFATDLHNDSIVYARKGIYPANITSDISARRLKGFFTERDGKYLISKSVRELVIFSKHNIIHDPPMSKMDVVCCRNMLIYFSSELQKRVLPLLAYALLPNGYLFLGASESLGDYATDYATVSSTQKIFRLKPGKLKPNSKLMEYAVMPKPLAAQVVAGIEEVGRVKMGALASHMLSKDHTPSFVVIDAKFTLLYCQGDTGDFLSLPNGEPSLNLMAMAREAIRPTLATLVSKAISQRKAVRSKELHVLHRGLAKAFKIIVRPMPRQANLSELYMVIFEDTTLFAAKVAGSGKRRTLSHIEALEFELKETKDYVRSLREEFDTVNEELKSTNEELQSTNEELQSTNEELETSKEEMQSTNEELESANAELNSTNVELQKLNNDITNLMSSTNIGTLFLDMEFKITQFTPAAKVMFNLIGSDIGRPISDITAKIRYDSIITDLEATLRDLVTIEHELQTKDGKWIIVRLMPYRTTDNRISGVVLTFIDVDTLKKTEEKLHTTDRMYHSLFDNMLNGFAYCKMHYDDKGVPADFTYLTVNSAFERLTGLKAVTGRKVSEVIPGIRENDPQLFEAYGRVCETAISESFETYVSTLRMWFNVSVYSPQRGYFVVVFDVITQRKQAEELIKRSLDEKTLLLREIHHRVKNNLAIISALLHMQEMTIKNKTASGLLKESQDRIKAMSLVHEMLYLTEDFTKIDAGAYIRKLTDEILASQRDSKDGLALNYDLSSEALAIDKLIPVGLIVTELVTNAMKYAFAGKELGKLMISMKVDAQGAHVLTVSDNGRGLPKGFTAKSLGLKIVRTLVKQLKGKMRITSGDGVTCEIIF